MFCKIKKQISLLLVVCFLIAFCSCSVNSNSNSSTYESDSISEVQSESENNSSSNDNDSNTSDFKIQVCYVYDANDNLLYSVETEYDTNGNVKRFVTYKADGTKTLWGENEYDSKGNAIKIVNGLGDERLNWIERVYDENNLLIAETIGYGSETIAIKRVESFCSEESGTKQIVEKYYDSNDEYLGKKSTTYDVSGNILGEVNYDSKEYYWFDHDVDGNPIEMSSDVIDQTLYQYDQKGRLIRINVYNKKGVITDVVEYLYDMSGNKIKELKYSNITNMDMPVSVETFEYDSNNKLISSVLYNYNGDIEYKNKYEYK